MLSISLILHESCSLSYWYTVHQLPYLNHALYLTDFPLLSSCSLFHRCYTNYLNLIDITLATCILLLSHWYNNNNLYHTLYFTDIKLINWNLTDFTLITYILLSISLMLHPALYLTDIASCSLSLSLYYCILLSISLTWNSLPASWSLFR